MKPGIVIVSLGTGDPDLLNMKTIRILRDCGRLILRTESHSAVPWLQQNGIAYTSLDYLYRESNDFNLLNRRIAEELIRFASDSEIVYAVPDPLTDQSVRTLLRIKPDPLSVTVIPGLSTYDVYLSSSLHFLPDAGVLTVPASDVSEHFHFDPNVSLLITELDNEILAGQVKLLLSETLGDDSPVFLLNYNHPPKKIPVWELDRQHGINHCSAVLIPSSGFLERNRFIMNDLTDLMDKLRSSEGCPWDRMQTHESLQPYMIEEAWECIASIDQHDTDHLCEELGDLLFQVVFHASIGKSFDEFSMDDIISSICIKMIRRHPHVFGNADLRDPESVHAAWERIKQEETGHLSVISSLEDVSPGLPSLKYASKVFRKLGTTSAVRLSAGPVLDDIRRLADHLASDSSGITPDQLGTLLLLCTELCFAENADGELILHKSVDRLKKRLKTAEKSIIRDGKSLERLTFRELGVYLKHVEGEIE